MPRLHVSQVATPLAAALEALTFIALFLSQIFIVTVAVLGLLGSVVIYALVLGDVEVSAHSSLVLHACDWVTAALVVCRRARMRWGCCGRWV